MKDIYSMNWVDVCITSSLTLDQKITLLKFLLER